MNFDFADLEDGPLSPPYVASRYVGLASAYVVTGLIACPGILLDWFYSRLQRSMSEPSTNEEENYYELRAFDIPYLLANIDMQETVIYRGGFFAEYPLGRVGEVVGTMVNIAFSAATFVTVGLLEMGIAFGAAAIMLMLVAGAALISSVYFLARSCLIGQQETCIETFQQVRACFQ